ncbi:putative protein TPRXL [Frankliniella occidentalis]|uniref:Uncharacterized protein n=1 Tax=Frankliniella occidentalis TaxID=133901 RepID=A0A9C6XQZ6_FRAOC|nr:putative protein TPRXL [Frankliniella occidentalis]
MFFLKDIIKPKNTSSNFSAVTSPLPPPAHCSVSLPSTSSSCSSLSLSSASFLQQSPSTSTSSSTFLELADPDDPLPAALLAAEDFASSIEVPVAVCSQRNTTFQNPGTAESLRSAAAQINPARTVPPCDIGKKRVRQSQEEVDQLKRSKDDLSSLTSSLTSALNSIAAPQPASATPPPPLTAAEKAKFSPQVELLIGSVSVALNKVPVERQVNCIIEMLQVAGKYSE